jgi:hypothetical protein
MIFAGSVISRTLRWKLTILILKAMPHGWNWRELYEARKRTLLWVKDRWLSVVTKSR